MVMVLEKETVHVAMSGAGVIGRRHFLQTMGAGAAGLLFRTGAMLDVPNKP